MTDYTVMGECPVCEKRVALDRHGWIRKHKGTFKAGTIVCPGWGMPALTGSIKANE